MTEPLKLVGPAGPSNAKICFVGEAPGETEVLTGVPFTGVSGKLLTQLLAGAGIVRSACYFTNTVKERPLNNNIEKFIKFKPKEIVETTEAYELYESALLAEVFEDHDFDVIVPVGRVALYALTKKFNITKQRGSIIEMMGKKVIPIIHPAGALRQYMWQRYIAIDLIRILAESKTPELNYPERDIQLRPTYGEVIKYLNDIISDNALYPSGMYMGYPIGFDIEVSMSTHQCTCLAIATSATDCMCIPFQEGSSPYFTPDHEYEVMRLVGEILESNDIVKVMQNGIFDAGFMLRRYGIHTRNIDDTMVAQGIIAPELPKGLDFICSTYTRIPYYKDDGKKWFKMGGTIESFWNYNALDSIACMEAMPEMLSDMKKLGNINTYNRQRNIIPPLLYMQERGVLMDVEGIKTLRDSTEVEIKTKTAEIQAVCGADFNPNSPVQVKTYFYIKKGLPAYTKGGKPTADEKALTRIARKGYKEAALILETRRLRKMLGTYLEMKFDSDDRLRTSYNPIGTKTGRLSSSQSIFGTGGNMQNIPKTMRKFMLADEGYLLYEVDLSQAENRIVANLARETSMLKAFENGDDVHALTASRIFGKPAADISDEDGSCSLGGGAYSERFWGKKANHGLNYGLGYKTFALYCQIPDKEGKFIYDSYHSAFPAVRQWHNSIKQELSEGRKLTNPYGRVRIFLDRWGPDLWNEAYNFKPQSTVADKINGDGLIPLYNDPQFEHLELLIQVHDSIVFQLPISIGLDKHKRILNAIKVRLELPIPLKEREFVIPADFKVGRNWYDMEKLEFPFKHFLLEASDATKV